MPAAEEKGGERPDASGEKRRAGPACETGGSSDRRNHQQIWRGYQHTTMDRLNRDAKDWMETANRRRYSTHGQLVDERWQQEIPLLGSLPATDYDTSVKVVSKVYKDCQISYNTNRYLVPYQMVGRKVLLKIKHGIIHVYDDQTLLVSYPEATGHHQTIGDRLFYEQLQRDRELNTR